MEYKIFFTLQFVAIVLAIGAAIVDREAQTTTRDDGWTRHYTIPAKTRVRTAWIGYLALLISIGSVLLLIWTAF